MDSMMHGTYVGPLAHLKGKKALLIQRKPHGVLAQFDDVTAIREPHLLEANPGLIWALSLGYGWHPFAASDFTVLPGCFAVQRSDSMVCRRCDLGWDMNDPAPPDCKPHVRREYRMDEWWHDSENRHGDR